MALLVDHLFGLVEKNIISVFHHGRHYVLLCVSALNLIYFCSIILYVRYQYRVCCLDSLIKNTGVHFVCRVVDKNCLSVCACVLCSKKHTRVQQLTLSSP